MKLYTSLTHIEYLLVLFHDGQVDGATAGSHLEISDLFIFIYTSMILSYIDQLVDFAASIDQLLGNICVALEYIGIFVCVCVFIMNPNNCIYVLDATLLMARCTGR